MEIMLAMFVTILISGSLSAYVIWLITTRYVKRIEALEEEFLDKLLKTYAAEIKKRA